MTDKSKHNIYITLMFGAYIFLHTTIMLLANRESNGYISAALEEKLYYIQLVFMILGLSVFAPVKRALGERTKPLTAAVLTVLAACIVILYILKTEWVFVGIGSLSMLCIGWLGALIYWRMSCDTANGSRTGLAMGIGSGAAYTLQYFLEGKGLSPVLPLIIALALASLGYVLFWQKNEPMAEVSAAEYGEVKKQLVCAVVIIAGLTFFNSFFNGYMHHLQIQSGFKQIDAYEWPRLMLVPIYITMGIIGDIRGGRYIPLASLCIGLVTLLHSVLVTSETAYWVNMCLFYFGIAAEFSYGNIIFCNLAPKSRCPELWASMGRSVDALLVILFGITRFSSLPAPAVLALNIAAIVVVIFTMAVNNDFNIFGSKRADMPNVDSIKLFQQQYSLTPSELKVARELLLTDDKQSVIAERLSIKVGTVQFHATNIYRKVGVENRAGLARLYKELEK